MNKYCGLFLILLLIGCTNPRYILDTNQVTFTELLDNIAADQQQIISLQASSRISVDSEEFSGNFFADIIYLNSDSLLLSVSGPFGIHAGTLFIGKKRFLFHNQIANKFYTGSVDEFRDRKFFQFPLNLSELINIFAAKESLQAMRIEQYDTRDDQFFMSTSNGALAYKIWINDFNGKITKISASQAGEELFVREYDDYKKSNGIYFPQKIKMVRPLARQAVSIYYTRFQLNETVDRTKFSITIPDHAEQIDFSNYTSGQ